MTRIVRERMLILDERSVERNFKADQHGAATLYYADCLRQLYSKISNFQRTKSARTPGSASEARRPVLGFPEKNTPASERTAIRGWCRQQLNKAQPGEESEMARSMRAYLADQNSSTSQAADPSLYANGERQISERRSGPWPTWQDRQHERA